jgi:hypothetical protein
MPRGAFLPREVSQEMYREGESLVRRREIFFRVVFEVEYIFQTFDV